MSDACCSPDREPSAPQGPAPVAPPSGDAPTHETTGTMVTLTGGTFAMGSDDQWAYRRTARARCAR